MVPSFWDGVWDQKRVALKMAAGEVHSTWWVGVSQEEGCQVATWKKKENEGYR